MVFQRKSGLRVEIPKVGSRQFLPPLPTGGATFCEDMTVGRGPAWPGETGFWRLSSL